MPVIFLTKDKQNNLANDLFMKEHNTLEEYAQSAFNAGVNKQSFMESETFEEWRKSNSLATEQPPENKDYCRCYRKFSNMHNSIEISMDKCNYCKGRISKK